MLAGLVAGLAGLGVSYAVALALTIRESPVVAVAEVIIRITPGPVAEFLIGLVGQADKTILVLTILGLLVLAFGVLGGLARGGMWRADVGFLVLTAVGVVAVLTRTGSGMLDLLPLLAGLLTWTVGLRWTTAVLLSAPTGDAGSGDAAYDGQPRRAFLLRMLAVGAVGAVAALGGRFLGSGRRHVEEVRRLVRLDVTKPDVSEAFSVDAEGVAPFLTPTQDFYLIHTAIAVPTIDPEEWGLRIHGMVDRELNLSYQDLVGQPLHEMWMTLNCVSNPVGGGLIGNAWWSGVRLSGLLAQAGAQPEADAVLQTSEDGWTCGTPLAALQDGRGAMLAVAMNGRVLPVEHGFPVRTLVPGLYGYVSACKWVVDLEVTRFDRISAFWTERGWSEKGPVKLASRIDTPRSGDELPAGPVKVGGSAWQQHTGVRRVQVAVDGGAWTDADLARVPSSDTWVQWSTEVELSTGEHELRVRAESADGEWQTGVVRDVVPDGSTGWHTIHVTAS